MTVPPKARPIWVTGILLGLCFGLVLCFILLGNWQMRRLIWKLDLIETVEARAFAAAQPLPKTFDRNRHEYLRIRASGVPVPETVLVKAVTDLGPGFWVMAPLLTDHGVLWINRGFVPPDKKDPFHWQNPSEQVVGLLRPTVPDGTILEQNDPQTGRWVSRDTRAMSDALRRQGKLGPGPTLPFFLDADHMALRGVWPRGGLTIVTFPNPHLAYALTWYAMAIFLTATLVALLWKHQKARPQA